MEDDDGFGASASDTTHHSRERELDHRICKYRFERPVSLPVYKDCDELRPPTGHKVDPGLGPPLITEVVLDQTSFPPGLAIGAHHFKEPRRPTYGRACKVNLSHRWRSTARPKRIVRNQTSVIDQMSARTSVTRTMRSPWSAVWISMVSPKML
jgi:hypothetical protein